MCTAFEMEKQKEDPYNLPFKQKYSQRLNLINRGEGLAGHAVNIPPLKAIEQRQQ